MSLDANTQPALTIARIDGCVLHATATGRPFGLDGHGERVEIRMLHVFDFDAELISRESPWLDMASLHQQLTP